MRYFLPSASSKYRDPVTVPVAPMNVMLAIMMLLINRF